MLPAELDELIEKIINQKCETQNIEIKKAGKGTPEKLYDTFSGFSNQMNGGIIVFGIDEKNDFEVTGVYDAQDLQVQVTNAALQMEPVVRPFFTVTNYKGAIVVSAEISECSSDEKPCFYKPAGRIRGSYVRVGDADLPMSEYEVYSYEVYKKKIRDELRTVDRSNTEDLNKDVLVTYFSKLKLEKPQLSKLNEAKILQLQGIISNEKPTIAGLMLACDYPQAFCPQLGITAMVVDGTEIGAVGKSGERFIDSKRFEGAIPDMLDGALAFVNRNMKRSVIIDNEGKRADKTEYPIIAVREIILNALIHRDYSIYTEDSPIRVIMYRDRLVVENPGGLYGRLTVNDLGKEPADTRNPFIAGNLEIMIDTENRFSGIPTICEEMKKSGLEPPLFESERGRFSVTLYNSNHNEKNFCSNEESGMLQEEILNYCQRPRTKDEIAEMLNIKSSYYVVTKYINPLIDEGKLMLTIPEKPKSKYQKYFSGLQSKS